MTKFQKNFPVFVIIVFLLASVLMTIASYYAFDISRPDGLCEFADAGDAYVFKIDNAKCNIKWAAFIEPITFFLITQVLVQVPTWLVYYLVCWLSRMVKSKKKTHG